MAQSYFPLLTLLTLAPLFTPLPASHHFSLAELTLMKSGTSNDAMLENDSNITFHGETYNLGAAEPSNEDTEGRKKKFLLDTIMSGSNFDLEGRQSGAGQK
jgi:hypothetical protein